MAFNMFYNTRYGSSYKSWEKDKERRTKNPTFHDDRQVQYRTNFRSTSKKKGGKSYDWESKYLWDLPRSYGRSYNDKFDRATGELGIESQAEKDAFRKYLDAKEKGTVLNDIINKDLNEANEKARIKAIENASKGKGEDKKPEKEPPRTLLDRVFDPLMAFNYASAGFAMGFADNDSDDDKNPFKRALDGLKAGNPFGKGDVKSEYTYSKVLEEAGWKPDSTAGKITKGVAGFALDVVLDPTTYLTLGTGAAIRGTGKAGMKGAGKKVTKEALREAGMKPTGGLVRKSTDEVIEKLRSAQIEKLVKENPTMSDEVVKRIADKKVGQVQKSLQLAKGEMTQDLATNIVMDTAKKRGVELSAEQAKKDAQSLMREYNRVRGIRSEQTGITVSLGNMPFGQKIFKDWADKKLEVISGEKIAKISDKVGVSKGYGFAREAILDGKIGELFSNKSKLKKLADDSPEKLYDYLKFLDITKGHDLKKIADEREIRSIGKQLAGLDPSEQKELMKLMEDKTVWHKISKTVKLTETKRARQIRKDLQTAQKVTNQELDDLLMRKNNLEGLANANEKMLVESGEELDVLRTEYRNKLADLDLNGVQDEKKLDEAISLFKSESEQLDKEIFNLNKREKIVSKHSSKLEDISSQVSAKHTGDMAKLESEQKTAVDGLQKETLEGRSEIDSKLQAEKQGLDDKKGVSEQLVKENKVDPTSYQGYFDQYAKMLPQEEGVRSNLGEKVKLVRQLNEGLFGGKDVLELTLRDDSLGEIVKMMQDGAHPDAIRKFVASNERMFSRKYSMIYQTVASALGYTSWDDTYTKVVKRLEDKQIRDGLTMSEKRTLANLERMNIERAHMVKGLSEMSEEEIRKYRNKYENMRMEEAYREVEKRENFYASSDGRRQSFVQGQDVGKEDVRVFDLKLTAKEHDDIVSQLVNEIGVRTGKVGVEGETFAPNKAQINYTMRVLDEVQPLLDNYFKRTYGDLTPAQKNLLINIAKQNEFLRASGKEVIKKPKAKPVDVKKKLTMQAMKAESERVSAIEKVINISSDVVYKSPDGQLVKGTVHAINHDDYGRLLVNVKDADGNLIKDVKSVDIRKVSQFKRDATPDEIISASLVNDLEIAKHEDAIESLMAQRDELLGSSKRKYDDLIKGFEGEKAALETMHQKELQKLEGKKVRNAKKKVEIEHLKSVLDGKKAEIDGKIAKVNQEYGARNVKAKQDLLSEYKGRVRSLKDNMKVLEELKHGYDLALKDNSFNDIELLQKNLEQLDDILASDDALETFIRTQYKVVEETEIKNGYSRKDLKELERLIGKAKAESARYAKAMKSSSEVVQRMKTRMAGMPEGRARDLLAKDILIKEERLQGMAKEIEKQHSVVQQMQTDYRDVMNGAEELAEAIVLPKEEVVRAIDLRSDITDTQKQWLNLLRGKFLEMGSDEVKIGSLKPEQFDRWAYGYLPHIPTVDGEKFLKSKKNIEKHGNFLTQDLGYGVKYNQFANERTISKETVGTAHDPTIEEINEHFKPLLKGKNLFSDSLSDIYVARAMKHTEVMYDNEYMDNMMKVFGDVIGEEGVKEGYKAVMNVGVLKQHINNAVKDLAKKHMAMGNEVTPQWYKSKQNEVIKSYGFNKGILDHEATPMVELNSRQTAILLQENPDAVRQVNDAIVQKANQARKLQIAKDRSKTLQLYDKFLHLMKINQTTVLPSFHMRNKFANLFNNWIEVGQDATSIEMHKDVFQALKHKGDPEVVTKRFAIKKGDKVVGDMSMAEAYDLAKSHGVVDEGFFAADLGAGAMSEGGLLKNIVPAKFNPLDTANNVLYKTGSKVGSLNENIDRMIHFVSQLRHGKTAEEASQSVNKVLFDYSDLTAFEQSVMKRIFPYYTFWRKNMKLQVSQVIDHPEKYRDTAKAINMVDGGVNEEDRIDKNLVDPFAQDWAQTAWNYTNKDGNKEPILWSPNLPFMDFNRIPNPFAPTDTLNSMISQSSPLFKVPLEQALNKNFFFNNELISEKTQEEGGEAEARLKHINSQFGLGNFIEGLVNKEGNDLALHVLNYTTGLKYMSYDVEDKKRRKLLEDKQKQKITKISEIADFEDKTDYVKNAIVNGLESTKNGLGKAISDVAKDMGVDVEGLSKQIDDIKWAVLDKTKLDEKITGTDFSTGQIVKVKDGDTFEVKMRNGEKITVRANLIDTPEISHYEGQKGMPYGNQAKSFAEDKLLYEKARLIIEGKDDYGRSMAYIITNGNENYAASALEEGMAKMTYLQDELGNKNLHQYLDKQQKAFNNEKGIWKIDGYADPDRDRKYRQKKKKKKK